LSVGNDEKYLKNTLRLGSRWDDLFDPAFRCGSEGHAKHPARSSGKRVWLVSSHHQRRHRGEYLSLRNDWPVCGRRNGAIWTSADGELFVGDSKPRCRLDLPDASSLADDGSLGIFGRVGNRHDRDGTRGNGCRTMVCAKSWIGPRDFDRQQRDRSAYFSLTVALIALVMAPIAALLLRNRPSDIGLPRYGETDLHRVERRSENPAQRALSALRRGLLSRDFWLLSGTFFICGASTNGLIGTHLIPACIDRGIPEVGAANLLAVIGVFDLVGTTVSGWLTDRFDSRRLLAWYYALRGLSLIFLPIAFNFNFYGLSIYAVFYGLDWVATVPPTVRLAGNVFGEENAALMFGWIAASHQVGAAAVAWLAGILRTQTGDYSIAFFSSGLLCLLAAFLASFIGSTSKRDLNPEPILEAS
jgi:hypothetical protein